jgi:hypothetical protein
MSHPVIRSLKAKPTKIAPDCRHTSSLDCGLEAQAQARAARGRLIARLEAIDEAELSELV